MIRQGSLGHCSGVLVARRTVQRELLREPPVEGSARIDDGTNAREASFSQKQRTAVQEPPEDRHFHGAIIFLQRLRRRKY